MEEEQVEEKEGRERGQGEGRVRREGQGKRQSREGREGREGEGRGGREGQGSQGEGRWRRGPRSSPSRPRVRARGREGRGRARSALLAKRPPTSARRSERRSCKGADGPKEASRREVGKDWQSHWSRRPLRPTSEAHLASGRAKAADSRPPSKATSRVTWARRSRPVRESSSSAPAIARCGQGIHRTSRRPRAHARRRKESEHGGPHVGPCVSIRHDQGEAPASRGDLQGIPRRPRMRGHGGGRRKTGRRRKRQPPAHWHLRAGLRQHRGRRVGLGPGQALFERSGSTGGTIKATSASRRTYSRIATSWTITPSRSPPPATARRVASGVSTASRASWSSPTRLENERWHSP